jgi:hypothetical protein
MDALSRPIERGALYFSPRGLGGAMPPEVAHRLLAKQAAAMELPGAVPVSVAGQFSKVLRMYADGLFTYANFTTCEREAHRVLEVALKVRFEEHYAAGVSIVRPDGTRTTESVGQFRARRPHDRARALAGHPRFNGSLAAHLRWARAEGYLYGQRNRLRERMTLELRNEDQHGTFDSVRMPPDAHRTLCFVSETIACLWGANMQSHIFYPGTIEREPLVLGRGPLKGEAISFTLGQLSTVEDDQALSRIWHVLSASLDQQLFFWQPDAEVDGTPVELLWGPGSWAQLHEAAREHSSAWLPDKVVAVDRVFFVRQLGDAFELPRTRAQARRVPASPGERWVVVQADGPREVMRHLQRVASRECRLRPCDCPVTVLYEPSRRETVLRTARTTR